MYHINKYVTVTPIVLQCIYGIFWFKGNSGIPADAKSRPILTNWEHEVQLQNVWEKFCPQSKEYFHIILHLLHEMMI